MPGKSMQVAEPESGADLFPALFGKGNDRAVLDKVKDALGGEEIGIGNLGTVKMPSGGGTFWSVPGERAPQETLRGVILAYTTPRLYWEFGVSDPEHVDKAPPDCSSDDGQFGRPPRIDPETGDITGGRYGIGSELHPDGDCETCPMNAWGSARRGRGKACAESRQLIFLLVGSMLPVIVRLPPTSIATFKEHIVRTAGKGLPWWGVVTEIELDTKKGASGEYSFATFQRGDALTDEEADQIKLYGEFFLEQMKRRGQRDASADDKS